MSSDNALLPYFSDLDRHFGLFMEKLSGGNSPSLFLAAALVSRSSGEGHICLELADLAGKQLMPETLNSAEDRPDGSSLVCPTLSIWVETLRNSPVVGRPGEYKPLILDDQYRLYLYRYWFYEDVLIQYIQGCLNSRGLDEYSGPDGRKIDRKMLSDYLHLLFPEVPSEPSDNDDKSGRSPNRQKMAALASLQRRFLVISGSPGTGKTTTAARIIALLRQLNQGKALRIALAAPTGKAAVRLEEAMKQASAGLDADSRPQKATTLHRLLGVLPGSTNFRYRRGNPLPYDLVVVDEASMVDLPLMAKLVMALPSSSRLILLGDRDQLASVEAGAVLGDLCGPPDEPRSFSPSFLDEALRNLTGEAGSVPETNEDVPAIGNCIISLNKNYRFSKSSGIGQFSMAVNGGDADQALSILNSPYFDDIDRQPLPEPRFLSAALRTGFINHFKEYFYQVEITQEYEALFDLFEKFRILCALRQGPFGSLAFNGAVENLLRSERFIGGNEKWYPGRPVMITRNDYGLGLFNGDVGLTLPNRNGSGLSIYFRDAGAGLRRFAPFRLPDHETVYAMTVHKSQGSEFNNVLLILSDRDTPLLTRELIYTGATRARQRLELWGNDELLRRAIIRRITRASGLRDALWQR